MGRGSIHRDFLLLRGGGRGPGLSLMAGIGVVSGGTSRLPCASFGMLWCSAWKWLAQNSTDDFVSPSADAGSVSSVNIVLTTARCVWCVCFSCLLCAGWSASHDVRGADYCVPALRPGLFDLRVRPVRPGQCGHHHERGDAQASGTPIHV